MKKIIGSIIYYSGLLYLISFTKKLVGIKEVTILMYHRIGDRNTELDQRNITTDSRSLDEQMKYLAKHCNVISFNELHSYCNDEEKIPKNCILITFDDGYKDSYSAAYPILKKYNLKATIGLTTGHIGGQELFWWDKIAYYIKKTEDSHISTKDLGTKSLKNKEKAIINIQEKLKNLDNNTKNRILNEIEKKIEISKPAIEDIFLSWDEIKEMCNNNITFASHTVTHPIMTRISLNEAKKEIIDSKKEIEYKINKKVNVFVYPNGNKKAMSKEIDAFLKTKGFIFSLSSQYGANTLKRGIFRLRRVHIENNDDMLMFKIKTKGFGKILAPIYGKLKELL